MKSYPTTEAVRKAVVRAASVRRPYPKNVRLEKRIVFLGTVYCFVGLTGCLDLETTTGSTTGGSTGGANGSVIQEWEAIAPADADGYELPAWLRIECGTSNRTSQVWLDQLQLGFGPHVARPRNVGLGWGLSVESRRRNQAKNSASWDGNWWNDPTMATKMSKTLGQPDPAGGMVATRFDSTGNQRSTQTSVPQGYASAWLKGIGNGPLGHLVIDNDGLSWEYQTIDGAASWQRYSAGIGSGNFFLTTEANPTLNIAAIAGATTIYAFAAQHETDGNGNTMKYPSSYIPTGDKDELRNADVLYSQSAPELIPEGYFHVTMKFAPNYAFDEAYSSVHHLLFINSTNHVRIDLDQGKITLVGVGNALSGPQSGALTWAREQEITVEAEVTPKGRTLSVSGAKEGNFTVSDAENRPWPGNGTFYILGDTSGAQECADLRYIGFFKPNE